MKKAVYPGSFDPITNGHVDIIERASRTFDHVYVLISINPIKNPLFSIKERIEITTEALKHLGNVTVDTFDGFVYKYAANHDARFIIRGLRTLTDYQSEHQLFDFNYNLSDKKIDTVAFFADSQYTFVSSSSIKELAHFKGDYSKYVPLPVKEALDKKFK